MVQWSVGRQMVISWLLTIPMAAVISGLILYYHEGKFEPLRETLEGNEKKRNNAGEHGLFGRMFPVKYDFYGMLNEQAEQTSVGVKALLTWLRSGANSDPVDVVREEDKGDQIRLGMERELQGAFSTPFDRQDIYTISRQMDYILNYTMSTAYEMKAFEVKPDEPVIEDGQFVAERRGSGSEVR